MIKAYVREANHIGIVDLQRGQTPPKDCLWVDLLNPEDNERIYISTALGIDLPNAQEMQEIEASSRLYAEGDTIYLTTDILVGADTPEPAIEELHIAITPACLITLRYSEPRAVTMFADRIRLQPDLIATVEDGALTLLDSVTDRSADILEALGRRVDQLSRQIFHPSAEAKAKHKEKKLQDILQGIGQAGDMTHKMRDCINGLMRLVSFLGPRLTHRLDRAQHGKLQALEHDVRSLSEHAQYVAHETTFLLDATLGQINIEQNNIIKIFSIAAVVFLPPTLLASIWGMNYHHMPELDSTYGYYIALFLMVISGITPLLYFKRRGWL